VRLELGVSLVVGAVGAEESLGVAAVDEHRQAELARQREGAIEAWIVDREERAVRERHAQAEPFVDLHPDGARGRARVERALDVRLPVGLLDVAKVDRAIRAEGAARAMHHLDVLLEAAAIGVTPRGVEREVDATLLPEQADGPLGLLRRQVHVHVDAGDLRVACARASVTAPRSKERHRGEHDGEANDHHAERAVTRRRVSRVVRTGPLLACPRVPAADPPRQARDEVEKEGLREGSAIQLELVAAARATWERAPPAGP
jgi:hypothetical protein